MKKGLLRRSAERFLPYIDKCVLCGIERNVEEHLCSRCSEKIQKYACGATSAKDYDAFSAYDYENEPRKLVRNYKYHDRRYLAAFLAQEMAKGLARHCDFITYVPLHYKRKKKRGFDQAELLAKELSAQTGIPIVAALERKRNTPTQTRLNAKEREENMTDAFASTQRISGRVVLVDDVLTTGATAAECAKVLIENGADDVFVLTFAKATGIKTPSRMWLLGKFFDIL